MRRTDRRSGESSGESPEADRVAARNLPRNPRRGAVARIPSGNPRNGFRPGVGGGGGGKISVSGGPVRSGRGCVRAALAHAEPELRPSVVGGIHLPARQPGQPARAPARRDLRPARLHLRGGRPDRRRVLAVRPPRPAGGSDRRPAPAPTDPRDRRRRPGPRARLRARRLRPRRPHLRGAGRRRVRDRQPDGVLRRRVPVDPARARRARSDHRRQLAARGQPVERTARRAGGGRAARAGDRRGVGRHDRRRELPRVGVADPGNPRRRAAARLRRRGPVASTLARTRDPRRVCALSCAIACCG